MSMHCDGCADSIDYTERYRLLWAQKNLQDIGTEKIVVDGDLCSLCREAVGKAASAHLLRIQEHGRKED